MGYAFVKGANFQPYDFLGLQMRQRQLRQQRRQARETRKQKEEKQMKQSGVLIAQFDTEPADKFKDGFEKITADIHRFAQVHANSLNKNNTATDDIEGQFNWEIYNVYQNMIRNAKKFVEHSNEYVKAYQEFEAAHLEEGEYGLGKKLDDSDVKKVDVFIDKNMLDGVLQGRSYSDLNKEEREKLSEMWYGHDKGNTHYYQDVKANDDGQYNFDEQGYLLDTEGNRVRGFERVGKKGRNTGRISPMEATGEDGKPLYMYQQLFNREFNGDNLVFTGNGDLTYGGTNYYKYWDIGMLNQNVLKEKRTEVDAVSKLADSLDYDIKRDILHSEATTEFFTDEAINGLRGQAFRKTIFRGGAFTNGDLAALAAHQTAYEILRLEGNNNPSEQELQRVEKLISSGKTDEGLIPDEWDFKYKFGKEGKEGKRIEYYSDFMAEYILEDYMLGHAMKDMHSDAYTSKLKRDQIPVTKDLLIKEVDVGGNQSYLSNSSGIPNITATRQFTVSNFQDVDGENMIKDLRDVGMITKTPFMTKSLAGVAGSTRLGEIGIAYIDRRNGNLITFDNQNDVSNNQAIFKNSEQAKYAYAVPVLLGSWTPQDKNNLRSNISVSIQNGKLTKDDGTDISSADIDNALNKDNSIDVYVPLNALMTQEERSGIGKYQEHIDKAEEINREGIFYYENGNKKQYKASDIGASSSSGDSFDFMFDGEFSPTMNV